MRILPNLLTYAVPEVRGPCEKEYERPCDGDDVERQVPQEGADHEGEGPRQEH